MRFSKLVVAGLVSLSGVVACSATPGDLDGERSQSTAEGFSLATLYYVEPNDCLAPGLSTDAGYGRVGWAVATSRACTPTTLNGVTFAAYDGPTAVTSARRMQKAPMTDAAWIQYVRSGWMPRATDGMALGTTPFCMYSIGDGGATVINPPESDGYLLTAIGSSVLAVCVEPPGDKGRDNCSTCGPNPAPPPAHSL